MSLFGRTTPRHSPRPVNLLPTDIPRFESQLIAADVLAPGPHPSMKPGKGTHLTPVRDDLADVVMIRPRKFECVTCGAPATRLHSTPVTNADPVRTCATCPRPGLRVVTDSDGVA